mmetsp:Transcript_15297/g.43370  ORF Transcript_15297/g.43370 Transcript_15297/m.43370 type:complete len:628 (-) Transcript_15297:60-1943(-)
MTIVLDDGMLQAWKPKGVCKDPPSMSVKRVELRIWQSDEHLSLPVYTNTKVAEVKALMEQRFGLDPGVLKFTHKQGSMYRENLDCEEIARHVTVRGIRSFARVRQVYAHPHGIIGAGHIGLKLAMTWLMEKPPYTNFVLFDKRPEVGGTSWWSQANSTSRLQTEVGVYHLEFHEDNGWPADCRVNPWPTRDQLLERFKKTSEEFGILPYCRMNTEVTSLNIIGRDFSTQYYELQLDHQGAKSTANVASVSFFPGNLTIPKRVIYQGEDQYDGDIVYGISDEFDYGRATGVQVAIIGSGAFAVENVRTCVEYKALKVFMICRRKTISMPRVVSWLLNQSLQVISAALAVEAMSPMYDLIGVDQWGYYSVFANESRTNVTIKQKSRFGIGDVYFLSMYFGFCEHIVDDIKRVSRHRLHLVSGRSIEDVPVMLKLLGFNGEFENDRLMKIKELYGWWVNRDLKRYIVAEPLGVDANNFAGTSFSPGAINWAESQVHLLHYPKDFAAVLESGAMPVHVADESIDRPAYVVEARHGSMTGISLGALVPAISERGQTVGPLKHKRMWQMHPLDSFLAAAKKEWDTWSKILQDMGYDREPPEYPYTEEIVKVYLEKEQEAYRQAEEAWLKRTAG